MDIQKLRELCDQMETLEHEAARLLGGEKKKKVCSSCGEEGHTARTCPQKSQE